MTSSRAEQKATPGGALSIDLAWSDETLSAISNDSFVAKGMPSTVEPFCSSGPIRAAAAVAERSHKGPRLQPETDPSPQSGILASGVALSLAALHHSAVLGERR